MLDASVQTVDNVFKRHFGANRLGLRRLLLVMWGVVQIDSEVVDVGIGVVGVGKNV